MPSLMHGPSHRRGGGSNACIGGSPRLTGSDRAWLSRRWSLSDCRYRDRRRTPPIRGRSTCYHSRGSSRAVSARHRPCRWNGWYSHLPPHPASWCSWHNQTSQCSLPCRVARQEASSPRSHFRGSACDNADRRWDHRWYTQCPHGKSASVLLLWTLVAGASRYTRRRFRGLFSDSTVW